MTVGTRATTRIGSLTIEHIEVTNFGDPLPTYVAGHAFASGEVTLADRTTLHLNTRLMMEEHAALSDLCDAIGARVLREIAEGLR